MIQLANNLWIGNSSTGWRELRDTKISAVLNVAQDLRGTIGWPDIEYMQVGLIDGPGNPLEVYYAAVLALGSVLTRQRTLVCCHTGGRSLAVAAMHLNVSVGRRWDDMMAIIGEKVDTELPTPHDAHKEAFDSMDWRLLRGIGKCWI